MKISSQIFKFEKVVTGTKEFELDDQNSTFLKGKSGGSVYVAAFYPEWIDEWVQDSGGEYKISDTKRFSGFLLISSTREREYRSFLSAGSMNDWSYLQRELKQFPHGEDILNWFTDFGEKYNHVVTTEDNFLTVIREWRKIN